MKFVIEIVKLDGTQPPQILHSFAHKASSVHLIREAMKAVMNSPQWPGEANGFRIISGMGVELHRLPRR